MEDYLPLKIANSQGLCEVGGKQHIYGDILGDVWDFCELFLSLLGFKPSKMIKNVGVHLVNLHTWKAI